MILGCFLPSEFGPLFVRYPALSRLERALSLSALRLLLNCVFRH